MSALDLTKNQKKIARQVIDIGLVHEFEIGIGKIDLIIQKWKNGKTETKETYYQIFESLKKFDKHIARRYDGMKGSDYLYVLAGQLADGVISNDTLSEFDQDMRNKIIFISGVDD